MWPLLLLLLWPSLWWSRFSWPYQKWYHYVSVTLLLRYRYTRQMRIAKVGGSLKFYISPFQFTGCPSRQQHVPSVCPDVPGPAISQRYCNRTRRQWGAGKFHRQAEENLSSRRFGAGGGTGQGQGRCHTPAQAGLWSGGPGVSLQGMISNLPADQGPSFQ